MSDLIDREAVRECIKSYRHSTDVAFDMEKNLDEIPAAPRWHMVKDGLPPKATWVLTVATEGNVKLFNIRGCWRSMVDLFAAEHSEGIVRGSLLDAHRAAEK